MTINHPVVLGSALWGVGLVSFGAFALAMNRPPNVHAEPSFRSMAPVEIQSLVQSRDNEAITLPEIQIVAQPLRFAPEVIAPPPPRDLSQMKCADWRPLEQGGSSVRECE